ncbi:MAG: hypothetical protein HY645_15170 [Acidobacteria bacterium]|nr:hypothetical protein [Acidobacteriota bacterium]
MNQTAKLYLLSLALFGIVFTVILVSAELWIRHTHLSNLTGETRDHVVETPYLPVKLKANHRGLVWGKSFHTNRYGFRGEDDFALEPHGGEFRILSLGDSIGFGLGIEPAQHYIKVLERELRRDHFQIRTINAGGQGYSPSGYYVYLLHEGLKFHPRLVLLEIELCNDLTDEALLSWEEQPNGGLHRVRGGRYVVGWDGNLLATYSRGPYFFEKTYVYTDLLRRLLNLGYRLWPNEPFHSTPGVPYYHLGFDRFLLSEARIEQGWKRIFGAISQTHRLLRDQEIGFLLLIMPSRFMFEENAGPYREFASRLVERARGTVRDLQIPFLDLTPAMQSGGGASLYFDFAHMTAAGNLVVSKQLVAHFAQAGLLP